MNDFRAIAIETMAVVLLVSGLALLLNALSPRGLRLDRNYFLRTEVYPEPTRPDRNPAAPGAGGDRTDPVVQRLARHGIRAAGREDVVAWFHDSGFAQGLIVFVDARDDEHYRAGHIPGAWQFNHYRAEDYLPSVLPACLVALKVVVYCSGGDCEDSEFAATVLRDAGVPRENLVVYPGGMVDWAASDLPVETGRRGSGQLRSSKR